LKRQGHKKILVGVISDTHGLLREQAVAALSGVDTIIHAGDIGTLEVLQGLQAVAPVVAVRGNMDGYGWAQDLPETEMVAFGAVCIYVLHDLYKLDIDPQASDVQAVISGHTHQPAVETKNGVLYLNPGSAGYKRHNRPTTIARLHIDAMTVKSEFIRL